MSQSENDDETGVASYSNFIFQDDSVEMTLDFDELKEDPELKQNLECCMCHELARNTMTCIECRELFCGKCANEKIGDFTTCPRCHQYDNSPESIGVIIHDEILSTVIQTIYDTIEKE
ncbi:hypothetical protein WA158_000274 [Blastocystis sp. Blastoise]